MPQIVRFGCAGVAVIIIAALTSVGLYAVLTGGFPFGGPAPKPISGGAQVLVTIQAGQPTPTPPSASTPTPAGGSAGAGSPSAPAGALAAPVAAPTATTPPTATPTIAPLQAPAAGASPGAATSLAASPARSGVGSVSVPDSARQTTYEGLGAEIVEVERGWQPTDPTGAPIRLREGAELVTVHIRMTNSAPETRYVSENDLVLVSEDGARYAPRQSGPQREPRLLTTPLLPGDIVRGWLTFETQSGLATRRLQWSPTRPDRPRAETTFNLTLP